jgi:alanine racemase
MATVESKAGIFSRPNWAEVSLGALRKNFKTIAQRVAPATVCAVIKCNAYGHGVVECGRALEAEGAKWFGVTSTEEGTSVREAGIGGRILLMTGYWRGEEDAIFANRLTPAIWTLDHVERLERAVRARRTNGKLAVHLKIDTGMGRVGVPAAEAEALARRIAGSEQVEFEGVFSHIASSEVLDAEDAAAQIVGFNRVLSSLRAAGLEPPLRHLSNSAAVAGRPDTWNTMVRPGLALYGYVPSPQPAQPRRGLGAPPPFSAHAGTTLPPPLAVEPVLSWKTRIISQREMPAGQAIGYNATYVTQTPSRIAVIAAGYGDGFNRAMSNKARVIVRDHYAPVVGRISMELTTIDVTEIPGTEIGDEVLLIGRSEHCSVTAADQARWVGTIPYEITCGINRRVPRVYVE